VHRTGTRTSSGTHPAHPHTPAPKQPRQLRQPHPATPVAVWPWPGSRPCAVPACRCSSHRPHKHPHGPGSASLNTTGAQPNVPAKNTPPARGGVSTVTVTSQHPLNVTSPTDNPTNIGADAPPQAATADPKDQACAAQVRGHLVARRWIPIPGGQTAPRSGTRAIVTATRWASGQRPVSAGGHEICATPFRLRRRVPRLRPGRPGPDAPLAGPSSDTRVA
jgi:hypothetical protein